MIFSHILTAPPESRPSGRLRLARGSERGGPLKNVKNIREQSPSGGNIWMVAFVTNVYLSHLLCGAQLHVPRMQSWGQRVTMLRSRIQICVLGARWGSFKWEIGHNAPQVIPHTRFT